MIVITIIDMYIMYYDYTYIYIYRERERQIDPNPKDINSLRGEETSTY